MEWLGLIASNFQVSDETEDRSQLALLACVSDSADERIYGESYIDLFIRNVLSVEMLLKRERDRREIEIKDLLPRLGKPLRKTTSVFVSIGHVDIFYPLNNVVASVMRSIFSLFDLVLPVVGNNIQHSRHAGVGDFWTCPVRPH